MRALSLLLAFMMLSVVPPTAVAQVDDDTLPDPDEEIPDAGEAVDELPLETLNNTRATTTIRSWDCPLEDWFGQILQGRTGWTNTTFAGSEDGCVTAWGDGSYRSGTRATLRSPTLPTGHLAADGSADDTLNGVVNALREEGVSPETAGRLMGTCSAWPGFLDTGAMPLRQVCRNLIMGTQEIDVPTLRAGAGALHLTMRHAYQFEDPASIHGRDGGWLEVRTPGDSWTRLDPVAAYATRADGEKILCGAASNFQAERGRGSVGVFPFTSPGSDEDMDLGEESRPSEWAKFCESLLWVTTHPGSKEGTARTEGIQVNIDTSSFATGATQFYGYPGVIRGEGRGFIGTSAPAGSQNPEFVEHWFDLAPYAGESVEIRLHATGGPGITTKDGGWWIDAFGLEYTGPPTDIAVLIEHPTHDSSFPKGQVPAEVQVVNLGRLTSNPVDLVVRSGEMERRVAIPALEPVERNVTTISFPADAFGELNITAEIVPPGQAPGTPIPSDPYQLNNEATVTTTIEELTDIDLSVAAEGVEDGTASFNATIENRGNTPLSVPVQGTLIPIDRITRLPRADEAISLGEVGRTTVPHSRDVNVLGAVSPEANVGFDVQLPEPGVWALVLETPVDPGAQASVVVPFDTAAPPALTEEVTGVKEGPTSLLPNGTFETPEGTYTQDLLDSFRGPETRFVLQGESALATSGADLQIDASRDVSGFADHAFVGLGEDCDQTTVGIGPVNDVPLVGDALCASLVDGKAGFDLPDETGLVAVPETWQVRQHHLIAYELDPSEVLSERWEPGDELSVEFDHATKALYDSLAEDLGTGSRARAFIVPTQNDTDLVDAFREVQNVTIEGIPNATLRAAVEEVVGQANLDALLDQVFEIPGIREVPGDACQILGLEELSGVIGILEGLDDTGIVSEPGQPVNICGAPGYVRTVEEGCPSEPAFVDCALPEDDVSAHALALRELQGAVDAVEFTEPSGWEHIELTATEVIRQAILKNQGPGALETGIATEAIREGKFYVVFDLETVSNFEDVLASAAVTERPERVRPELEARAATGTLNPNACSSADNTVVVCKQDPFIKTRPELGWSPDAVPVWTVDNMTVQHERAGVEIRMERLCDAPLTASYACSKPTSALPPTGIQGWGFLPASENLTLPWNFEPLGGNPDSVAPGAFVWRGTALGDDRPSEFTQTHDHFKAESASTTPVKHVHPSGRVSIRTDDPVTYGVLQSPVLDLSGYASPVSEMHTRLSQLPDAVGKACDKEEDSTNGTVYTRVGWNVRARPVLADGSLGPAETIEPLGGYDNCSEVEDGNVPVLFNGTATHQTPPAIVKQADFRELTDVNFDAALLADCFQTEFGGSASFLVPDPTNACVPTELVFGHDEPVFALPTNWTDVQFDLTPFQGQRVVLEIHAMGLAKHARSAGQLRVDDWNVREGAPPLDLAADHDPAPFIAPGVEERFKLIVNNTGASTLQEATVRRVILDNDGCVAEDSHGDVIPPTVVPIALQDPDTGLPGLPPGKQMVFETSSLGWEAPDEELDRFERRLTVQTGPGQPISEAPELLPTTRMDDGSLVIRATGVDGDDCGDDLRRNFDHEIIGERSDVRVRTNQLSITAEGTRNPADRAELETRSSITPIGEVVPDPFYHKEYFFDVNEDEALVDVTATIPEDSGATRLTFRVIDPQGEEIGAMNVDNGDTDEELSIPVELPGEYTLVVEGQGLETTIQDSYSGDITVSWTEITVQRNVDIEPLDAVVKATLEDPWGQKAPETFLSPAPKGMAKEQGAEVTAKVTASAPGSRVVINVASNSDRPFWTVRVPTSDGNLEQKGSETGRVVFEDLEAGTYVALVLFRQAGVPFGQRVLPVTFEVLEAPVATDDPNPGDNVVRLTGLTRSLPRLVVSDIDPPRTAITGDEIPIPVLVENKGNVPLRNVTVTVALDPAGTERLADEPIPLLLPGKNATARVLITPRDAGSQTVLVTATAENPAASRSSEATLIAQGGDRLLVLTQQAITGQAGDYDHWTLTPQPRFGDGLRVPSQAREDLPLDGQLDLVASPVSALMLNGTIDLETGFDGVAVNWSERSEAVDRRDTTHPFHTAVSPDQVLASSHAGARAGEAVPAITGEHNEPVRAWSTDLAAGDMRPAKRIAPDAWDDFGGLTLDEPPSEGRRAFWLPTAPYLSATDENDPVHHELRLPLKTGEWCSMAEQVEQGATKMLVETFERRIMEDTWDPSVRFFTNQLVGPTGDGDPARLPGRIITALQDEHRTGWTRVIYEIDLRPAIEQILDQQRPWTKETKFEGEALGSCPLSGVHKSLPTNAHLIFALDGYSNHTNAMDLGWFIGEVNTKFGTDDSSPDVAMGPSRVGDREVGDNGDRCLDRYDFEFVNVPRYWGVCTTGPNPSRGDSGHVQIIQWSGSSARTIAPATEAELGQLTDAEEWISPLMRERELKEDRFKWVNENDQEKSREDLILPDRDGCIAWDTETIDGEVQRTGCSDDDQRLPNPFRYVDTATTLDIRAVRGCLETSANDDNPNCNGSDDPASAANATAVLRFNATANGSGNRVQVVGIPVESTEAFGEQAPARVDWEPLKLLGPDDARPWSFDCTSPLRADSDEERAPTPLGANANRLVGPLPGDVARVDSSTTNRTVCADLTPLAGHITRVGLRIWSPDDEGSMRIATTELLLAAPKAKTYQPTLRGLTDDTIHEGVFELAETAVQTMEPRFTHGVDAELVGSTFFRNQRVLGPDVIPELKIDVKEPGRSQANWELEVGVCIELENPEEDEHRNPRCLERRFHLDQDPLEHNHTWDVDVDPDEGSGSATITVPWAEIRDAHPELRDREDPAVPEDIVSMRVYVRSFPEELTQSVGDCPTDLEDLAEHERFACRQLVDPNPADDHVTLDIIGPAALQAPGLAQIEITPDRAPAGSPRNAILTFTNPTGAPVELAGELITQRNNRAVGSTPIPSTILLPWTPQEQITVPVDLPRQENTRMTVLAQVQQGIPDNDESDLTEAWDDYRATEDHEMDDVSGPAPAGGEGDIEMDPEFAKPALPGQVPSEEGYLVTADRGEVQAMLLAEMSTGDLRDMLDLHGGKEGPVPALVFQHQRSLANHPITSGANYGSMAVVAEARANNGGHLDACTTESPTSGLCTLAGYSPDPTIKRKAHENQQDMDICDRVDQANQPGRNTPAEWALEGEQADIAYGTRGGTGQPNLLSAWHTAVYPLTADEMAPLFAAGAASVEFYLVVNNCNTDAPSRVLVDQPGILSAMPQVTVAEEEILAGPGTEKRFRFTFENAGAGSDVFHVVPGTQVPRSWEMQITGPEGEILYDSETGIMEPIELAQHTEVEGTWRVNIPAGRSSGPTVNLDIVAYPLQAPGAVSGTGTNAYLTALDNNVEASVGKSGEALLRGLGGMQSAGRTEISTDAEPRPDISVVPEDISVQNLEVGREAAFSVTVENKGERQAKGVAVQASVSGPSGFRVLESLTGEKETTVSIPPGGQVKALFKWNPLEPGEHRLRIVADPDEGDVAVLATPELRAFQGLVYEEAECLPGVGCNNVADKIIDVTPLQRPDLAVELRGIPEAVTAGERVPIQIVIENKGGVPATSAELTLTENGLLPILEDLTVELPDIDPGQQHVIEADWIPVTAGEIVVIASVQAPNEFKAIRVDGTSAARDNTFTQEVEVRKAGLKVSLEKGVTIKPGQPTLVQATVSNDGTVPAQIGVEPVVGDSFAMAAVLDQPLTVEAGSEESVTVLLFASEGSSPGERTARLPTQPKAQAITFEVARDAQASFELSTTRIKPGTTPIQVSVENTGNVPLRGTLVAQGDNITGAAEVELPTATNATLTLPLTVKQGALPGSQDVALRLESEDLVTNETVRFTVQRAPAFAMDDTEPRRGINGTLALSTNLSNIGNAPAAGHLTIQGAAVLSSSPVVSLQPGQETTVRYDWSPELGTPGQLVLEDLAGTRLYEAELPSGPDPTDVHVASINLRPSVNLEQGMTVTIVANAENMGSQPLNNTPLGFLVDGELVGTQEIGLLEPGETQLVSHDVVLPRSGTLSLGAVNLEAFQSNDVAGQIESVEVAGSRFGSETVSTVPGPSMLFLLAAASLVALAAKGVRRE